MRFSRFSLTKSAAKVSKEDSRRPPSEPPCGVHELVARSSAWQVCAGNGNAKAGSLATLYNFVYTTRANISHEKAEQIRARIVCTPAEKRGAGVAGVRALTELSKQTSSHHVRTQTRTQI